MQTKLLVFAVTDIDTDVGNVIIGIDKHGKKTHEPFGWWCESWGTDCFDNIISGLEETDIRRKGIIAFEYLKTNYNTKLCSDNILK